MALGATTTQVLTMMLVEGIVDIPAQKHSAVIQRQGFC